MVEDKPPAIASTVPNNRDGSASLAKAIAFFKPGSRSLSADL
jgi:hypothetical protein